MDKTVPKKAQELLKFIAKTETSRNLPEAYEVIYGHNQKHLSKPLISMTIAEVLAAGPKWANLFGSSATGAYQFMAGKNHTLQGLKEELGLRDGQVFNGDLQDRLGYHLLLRRGFAKWVSGDLATVDFAKNLAKEWASFPVLQDTRGAHRDISRGQSYYSGDAVNKALVSPAQIEQVLSTIRSMPVEEGIISLPKEKEMDRVTVPIESAWYSKINWISFAGPIASILIALGWDVSESNVQSLINLLMTVIGIQGGQGALTWIFRTWFTKKMLKPSV